MRRFLALALLAVTACTPAERAAWSQWYASDPDAALAFLETYEEPTPPSSRYGSAVWERIARCESGGDWNLRASNRTGSYGGGLMIRDSVWRAYGGGQYASTADRASKSAQITVAERIADDVGLDAAWQCWP